MGMPSENGLPSILRILIDFIGEEGDYGIILYILLLVVGLILPAVPDEVA
jgi:hypothetical protein